MTANFQTPPRDVKQAKIAVSKYLIQVAENIFTENGIAQDFNTYSEAQKGRVKEAIECAKTQLIKLMPTLLRAPYLTEDQFKKVEARTNKMRKVAEKNLVKN